MVYSYNTGLSTSYTATAVEIDQDMLPGAQYRLYCTTDAWFRLTAEGVDDAAAGGADSHPITAGQPVLVAAVGDKNRISVIRATADGTAALSMLLAIQPGI